MKLPIPLFFLAIASFAGPKNHREPAATAPGAPTTGVASFYSTRYDGRVTASGQRFHSNLLTAASRDLPMGSKVRIKNLSNNRSVVVRVNDRGPFVKGRAISVTRRAARELGFTKAGTARVEITPL